MLRRSNLPPRRARTDLTAFRLVPPPGNARRLSKIFGSIVLVAVVLLVFVPWVQTVSGTGKVIAFTPSERSQTVDSPLKGRVLRWLVIEGDPVQAGQPIVEIQDLDPDLTDRLELQVGAGQAKINAQTAQIQAFDDQVAALRELRVQALAAQRAYLDQAIQKREAAAQKLEAATTNREVASLQRERLERLALEGLTSQRDIELATASLQKAEAELRSAQADLRNAERTIDAERIGLAQKAAEIDAKIQDILAKREKVRGDREDARAKLAQQETKLARQGNRIVTAPRDGTLFRIIAFEGPALVKVGDPLGIIVPNTQSRAVELFVDGNDAAWVETGRQVRLQFEGWPAIQFAGWPGASVGTFGGTVTFIDATDDGKGNFRVVVSPDETDAPWPDPNTLRQGVRAKGWVLLDTVTLGFEAWRRLNGFPPQSEIRKVPKVPKIKL